MQKKFLVENMTCASCAQSIEDVLKNKKGIKKVLISIATSALIIDYDESVIDDAEIISILKKIGYIARGEEASSAPTVSAKKDANVLSRLIQSAVLTAILMYFSMGAMHHKWPLPSFLKGAENAAILALIQLLLTIPILLINREYFKVGFSRLIKGRPNMDSLISISAAAAFLYGLFITFALVHFSARGNFAKVEMLSMDLYFESAVMVLTFITIGKFIEEKSKKKTAASIALIIKLRPQTANVINSQNEEIEVNAEDLKVGDIVVIRPGETISADGIVVSGQTFVDESILTGESMPVEKTINSKVLCGTINQNGTIFVKVNKKAEDTVISQIIRLVESASASKAPISKLADKISGIFVPIVMVLSLISFAVWMIAARNLSFALSIAAAVLIISCPCALGLATPLAITAGVGKGAEKGILIKTGEALQVLHAVDVVAFDKTGTITSGKLNISTIKNYSKLSEDDLIQILYSLERLSEHPIAHAIANYAKEREISYKEIENFEPIFGKGVQAKIEGSKYFAGNFKFIEEKIEIKEQFVKDYEDSASLGMTPIILANEREALGIISISDTIKDTSKEAVKLLKERNIEVVMITGDNQKTANHIAQKLNIEKIFANTLPDQKQSIISDLQKNGKKVCFVGDGVNDAPALMGADIGIAIGAGTDIAVESADIILTKDDLLDVVEVINLSKYSMKIVKQNLFWAFIYNTLAIPIAMGALYPFTGYKLTPALAAILMTLSDIFVVFNALRIKEIKSIKNTNKKQDIEIEIIGLHCQNCVNSLKEGLSKIKGAQVIEISLEEQKAIINAKISDEKLTHLIEEMGFGVKNVKRKQL